VEKEVPSVTIVMR